MNEIRLYSDGACQPNPGKGGWAFIAKKGDEIIYQDQGFVAVTTNSRMELKAALEAIKYAIKEFPECDINIYSDSKYFVEGFNIWIYDWKESGWRKSDGDKVQNLDLWKRLASLKKGHRIFAFHVDGHSGHPENEYVDYLAVASIKDKVIK